MGGDLKESSISHLRHSLSLRMPEGTKGPKHSESLTVGLDLGALALCTADFQPYVPCNSQEGQKRHLGEVCDRAERITDSG